MTLHDVAIRIENLERIDSIAQPLGDTIKKLIPRGRLKDLLSGTWLGHPLHPLLTDIPIGSFTSATLLDLLGRRHLQPAANLLAGVGVLSAVPTAAAGLADWSDTNGPGRRVGVVHAAANLVGVGFYTASIVTRRRGNRFSSTTLGLMGVGVMTLGGYLGGHLSLVRGIGVNHAMMDEPTSDWTVVADNDDLVEGKPLRVYVGEAPVLLYRSGGMTYAISNRCTHAGGPLNEGGFDDSSVGGTCVTCPWHQSVFRLTDGSVVHGPATVPEPSYELRAVDGKLEVRPR
ncbi:MAG: Rieske 2Fe-2S domain-containing protein [Ilumatobacteraceae bacterium]